jgi:signal transduction histidine kinase
VDAATRRTAYYPYVPAGEYRFLVTACNSAGVWNPVGTSLALVVAPHWWQTWWFRAVAGLALLGSVGGMARLAEKRRMLRQVQHLEEERTLERERARIAQDLHDELGASLTRISLLSDLVKADSDSPAQVETHAAKISLSAAQTVRALEEIVWALRPGSDTLQSLIEYIAHFATELFDGDQARCRLDLQHDLPTASLPPEMRHNIFLIVKEALTNALKHAGAKEVHVQAKASKRSLEISVRDDGIGFEPPPSPQAGKRHGLGNMHRRAEAMGATLSVQSAPGNGTTVRLVVTLSNW